MKLLSCYIAGFGKFINRSFDLSGDLVVVKEDNGWGKTTFADFIKCMLYGMDNGRSKAVVSNDRLKYEPWQGGAFGGSLTFLYGGRTYRIERAFGKTPSADVARVYDHNNMQCYDFGDNAQRLGEVLFGVDRDSYGRSVYIPQGTIETGSLPDDVKNRLLSLLGAYTGGGKGGETALAKLDEAERKLRAKRKPAKGKLDEIDERLDFLRKGRMDCDGFADMANSAQSQLLQIDEELALVTNQLQTLSAQLEMMTRQGEFVAKRESYRQISAQKAELQSTLNDLTAFFGTIDPVTLNIDGLQTAVTEFYTLKAEIAKLQEQCAELEAQVKEKSTLQSQLSTFEKAKESYDLILQKNKKKTGAGTPSTKKEKKKIPKKGRFSSLLIFLFIFAAIFGATQTASNPALGYTLLGIGGLGMVVMFFKLLPKGPMFVKKEKKIDEEMDEDFALQYKETQANIAALQQKLSVFPLDLEKNAETLKFAYEEKNRRANGIEQGICTFLDHFRFPEIYDYRQTLTTLKEKMEAHAKCKRALNDCEASLSNLTPDLSLEQQTSLPPQADIQTIRTQKAALESRKEELLSTRASLSTQAENYRLQGDVSAINEEESRLTEEKNRLERRLEMIRATRNILARALDNMATRYLQPVEENSRKYLAYLDETASPLCFSADGTPLFQENGATRLTDFYSAGRKDLAGFCTRIALADAMFTREYPTLVLDDPFINLDDEKTEKAKRLVKELSKKYQILYFTCKSERRL